MPAALMAADVVVMPSITPEPFGRVALEAQAMGRPIVAFDHGGAMSRSYRGNRVARSAQKMSIASPKRL